MNIFNDPILKELEEKGQSFLRKDRGLVDEKSGKEYKKFAYGYTRVSTKYQVEDGFSLETQEDAIKKYCDDNEYKLVEIYSDAGISGKTINKRPQLVDMLSLLKPNSLVVVNSLTRLSRSVADFYKIVKIIEEADCVLRLLDYNIQTNDDNGRLIMSILATLSEAENTAISNRTAQVMNDLSRKKKLRCKPPIGYMIDKNTKKICVNEVEMSVVNIILHLDKEGSTISEIIKYLTRRGFKLRNAKKFYQSTIIKIISDFKRRKDNIEGELFGADSNILHIENSFETHNFIETKDKEQLIEDLTLVKPLEIISNNDNDNEN
jgi:site-specific DNA recombinase